MFGLNNELVSLIKDIVKKYPDNRFVVFGSRARGDFKYNSDIDIAVLGNVSYKDETKIRIELDSIDMEYMIDIVFVNKVTNKELIENIEKEGVEI